jgi:hypothetical protein
MFQNRINSIPRNCSACFNPLLEQRKIYTFNWICSDVSNKKNSDEWEQKHDLHLVIFSDRLQDYLFLIHGK